MPAGSAEIGRSFAKLREDHSAGARFCSQEARECERGCETQSERNNHSEKADQEGAFALAEDAAQIDFKSCGEKEKYDAYGCDGFQHRQRDRDVGDRACGIRLGSL